MKIRIIQPVYINGRQQKPGALVDLHNSIAQWLVDRGRAEPAEPAPTSPASGEPSASAEAQESDGKRKRKTEERRTEE